MATTVMSSKGQVVIPARLRRALRLREKEKLRVEEKDGGIFISRIEGSGWRSLRGSLAGTSATAALERERRAERRREG